MDKVDIPFLSATQLSRLIEKREVSPVEAVQAYLDRIDDLDFKYNSYLTVCRKSALQAAQEAEQAIAAGNYLGPMHGIPVAVKDQVWSKDVRSTGGSRFLADSFPEDDATAIANLKKAGAILLGKTNMTEFAITGTSHRYSTPRNPWDLDKYTGGSSSGSAAATTAFLTSTSIGEDTGGSIRWPSSWCGLAGFKPSWGRVSRYGVMKGSWSLDTLGPMSRTVEDAAITLGAIAGYDPKDTYTWDVPVPNYTDSLTGDIHGVRVGLISELTHGDSVDPQVREAVVKATKELENLGASVEEVSLPLSVHGMLIMQTQMGVESSSDHREWVRNRLHDYGHTNRVGLLSGSIIPAQAYYKAQKLRTLLSNQVQETLQKYDVLVSPTMAETAHPIQDDATITSKEAAIRVSHLITFLFNLTGGPAITVPCGFSSQKLPIGFQIGGKPFDEGTVARVAHAYEQNTPWHTMRPPL